MHEQELVAEALETLRSLASGEPIRTVEIALGPGVDRRRATAAWRDLTKGTPMETTHVIWEGAVDMLRCVSCAHEYPAEETETCPYCGGDGVVIEPAEPIQVGRWTRDAA